MWRLFTFWFYPLAALTLVLYIRQNYPAGWLPYLSWILAGVAAWTVLEYLLHRFLFHGDPGNSRLLPLRRTIHLHHHGRPRNAERILIRPVFSLTASGALFGLLYLLTQNFFLSAGVMTGLWTGFLYYESVHLRIHLSKREGPLLTLQRRSHFYHHYVDDRFCYGVTSPIWDFLLGTYRSSSPGRSSNAAD